MNKRPEDVVRALDYLEGIYGDYGKHEKYTKIVKEYIEKLEDATRDELNHNLAP